MRSVIEIHPDWLLEIAPHYYKPSDILDEDAKKKLQPKMPLANPKNTK